LGEEDGRRGLPEAPISAEGIGMLVAFLETRRMEQRRYRALRRLAALEASETFDDLPEDLRQRIHDLVAEYDKPPG
jgi:hypothetical protein